MNASVAIVIVGDEKNTSFSWTTDFPPVLLTDELSVSDNQHDKCNNFGRVATKGASLLLLSPRHSVLRYSITPVNAWTHGSVVSNFPLRIKIFATRSAAVAVIADRTAYDVYDIETDRCLE